MTSEFTSLVTSDIVELMAEQGQTRFLVHKDILASQSQPFRDAITGIWKEATERKIDLEDWSGDTVGRLVEFLYTGDYRYPNPEEIISTPVIPETGTVPEPNSEETVASNDELQFHMDRPSTPLNECLRSVLPQDQVDPETDTTRLESFDPAQYDYKGVLFSHAETYVLAHYKSVDQLQALALKRLLITLSRINPIQPDSHTALSIVHLADYVYANTDHLANSEEPLRRLISHFITLNLPALRTRKEMVDLMNERGDLTIDVMAKVCRRFRALESCLHAIPTQGRFVSNIRASVSLYSAGYGSRPPDRLRALGNCGTSGQINESCGGDYVWLVPEYTVFAEDACTGFQLLISSTPDHTKENIASGSSGMFRYLVPIKDRSVKEKITQVALLRDKSAVGSVGNPTDDEYDGMTPNINLGRSGYLYVIWKTVKIT